MRSKKINTERVLYAAESGKEGKEMGGISNFFVLTWLGSTQLISLVPVCSSFETSMNHGQINIRSRFSNG